MEEVARYECVYHRNSKDFKNKNKTDRRSLIYRLGKRRPNFATQELRTNPKPMFSTDLELTTTSLHDKQKK